MTELILKMDSYVEVTREAIEDQWDRDDTHTSWSFGPIYFNHKGYDHGSFITDFDVNVGDVIYVVVAVWSTGDSFGHDSASEAEVFGAFKTYEEAEKFQTDLESTNNITYKIGDREVYKPWNGYFESLDYITIVSGVVT